MIVELCDNGELRITASTEELCALSDTADMAALDGEAHGSMIGEDGVRPVTIIRIGKGPE